MPVSTSSLYARTSLMTSRRSPWTQARSGALKDAFGRWTISWGSQLSAARLSATLPWRRLILSPPGLENAAGGGLRSTPHGSRQACESVSHEAGEVLAVAAEQLVGAHPGEDHLDTAVPGRLAHQQRVDGRGISDRLVNDIDYPGKKADDVRRHLDFMQADAEVGRYRPRLNDVYT